MKFTRRDAWILIAVALIVLAGLSVRVGGLFTEMWIDEIWTLGWGFRATSVINLVTAYFFMHDNNHPLNSAYIYLIGRQSDPIVYRLFAFVCGIGTLVLAWLIGWRQGRVAALLGLSLVAGSYQLAHYSSEARGYAPAVFFALLAWYLLERFLDRGRWYDVVGFWFAVACGLLAHLTFVYAMAGFVAMTASHLVTTRPGWRKGLGDFFAVHMLPLAFTYALWAEFIRRMRLGGGPQIGVRGAVLDYAAHFTGAPTPLLAGTAIVLLLGMLAVAAWRQGANGWLLVGLLLSPVMLIAVRDPRFLYSRYFLICTPFVLLILARWMVTLQVKYIRVGAAVLVCLWLDGQARMTIDFMRYGRGHYDAAMAHILNHSEGDVIQVASGLDRPWRDEMLVGFHGRVGARSVRLWGGDEHTEWLVRSSDGGAVPDQVEKFGNTFRHDRAFPFAGLSGTPWHVYRRAAYVPNAPRPERTTASGSGNGG